MKNKYLVKIMLACFMAILLLIPITWAYYEYRGQYTAILNFDGTIKLDAFDVLYPELRADKTYGNTPENPYVVDSIVRLQNLIQLNNNGKLKKAKQSQGVSKYYFCLDFDTQTLPQVLNLAEAGLFNSIGNNEHPFEDELAGIVYGYELTENNIVLLSGCLPKVEITTDTIRETVLVDGVVDSALSYSDYHEKEGTYLKLQHFYDEDEFEPGDEESVVFKKQVAGSEVIKYIKTTDVTVCHQMIANETIVADTEQMDVGFISRISETGYVHDVILYNETISCNEETTGALHKFFTTLFKSTDSIFTSHHFADTEGHSDERHVGFFAGHIDGAAANISVAGVSQININTKEVNYYSQFTTVGYIYDFATIGGIQFNELSLDSITEGGSVAGCLFADNIYQSVESDDVPITTSEGVIQYKLVDISRDIANGWPGLKDAEGNVLNKFTYGSFNFILSNGNDTVSRIWNNSDGLCLLGQTGYTITGSALYIADEYRYSDEVKPGSAMQQAAASVKEMLFSGISSLKATGSIVDAGKYLITAKVYDESKTGKYAYYALKLVASEDASGIVTYSFDTSTKIDVTDFVLDDTGTEKLYQSALWEVGTGSKTPTFENCRFEGKYLTRTDSTVGFSTETASTFEYSSTTNRMYYSVKDEDTGTTTQYFLNFDKTTNTFSMSETANTDIVLWYVNNGYNLRLVTNAKDVVENGDYVIVARNENNSYLLGIDNTNGVISDSYATTDRSYVTANFPTSVTVEEYETIKNYIWHIDSKNNATISLIDKSSLTYYIHVNDSNKLALSTDKVNWTYTYNNGSILSTTNANGTRYMNYTYTANQTATNFATSNQSYTLYLYRIIPQDDTPLFITYEGARYVDADSTKIEAGDYVIVGVNGSKNFALGLTTATTPAITNTASLTLTGDNPTIPPAVTNYFRWTVGETSTTPTFKNISKNTYYLRASTTAVNTGTSSMQWMYDASKKNMFFISGNTNTKYYLVVDSNGNFSIKEAGNTSYSYTINLHKIVNKYSFTGVKIATSFTDNYYYLVSYADLSDTSKSQFLVGYKTSGSSSIIDSFDLSDKYKIINPNNTAQTNVQITTTSSVTIETISEMTDYVWVFSHDSNNGNLTYGYLYNYGYKTKNNITDNSKQLYMGASADYSNRKLTVATIRQGGKSSSNVNTGFYYYVQTDSTQYLGLRIGFKGGTNVYALCDDTVEGQYQLINNSAPKTGDTAQNCSVLNDSTYKSKNGNVDPPKTYIYEAGACTTTVVLDKISSDGDSLDQGMHYVIATPVVNGSITNYYALTFEQDEDKNNLFVGTDVTEQVELIMSKGQTGHQSPTNVPTNADWTNKSDDYKLRFYHTATSTNAEQNYIKLDGTSFDMEVRSSKTAITDLSIFYYDIINKIMKVVDNGNTYYLKYDSSDNTFGVTATESEASEIDLIRYTPTYKVDVVTDFYDEQGNALLEDGDFIIAGHTANGYIAIGTDGVSVKTNFDITNYLGEELSEADYQSILNYVFKQVYFNYNETASYTEGINGTEGNYSGYVVLQIYTEADTGSIAALTSSGTKITTYASAFKWKVTKQADGTWKFVNNQKGTTSIGDSGITFNAGNATSKLTVKDPNKAIGFYFDSLTSSATFDGDGSNIYVYDRTTGERITGDITSGNTYFLVGETNGLKFIIGNNNNNIMNTRFDGVSLSTFTNDSKYSWTFTTAVDGYSIQNNNRYIRVNNGNMTLNNAVETGGYFSVESGLITYHVKTAYRGYTRARNSFSVDTSTNNETHLYTYVQTDNGKTGNQRRYTYTLTKATAPFDSNTTYALVSKVGDTYYWANLDYQTYWTLTNNNGTLTYTTANNTAAGNNRFVKATINPNNSDQYYIRSANGSNYWFNVTQDTCSRAGSATYVRYDSTEGFCYIDITNVNIELTGFNGFGTLPDPEGSETGKKTILYKYEDNQYKLVNSDIDKGQIVLNGTYIAILLDDNNNYQIIGIDPQYDIITLTSCGNYTDGIDVNTFGSIVNSYNYLKASTKGAFGYALQFTGVNRQRYLGVANNLIKVVDNSNTYWEMSFDDKYVDNSRLFTVTKSDSPARYLGVSGNRVIPVDSGAETYMYNISGSGTESSPYKLNGLTGNTVTVNTNHAIVIYTGGCYYVVTMSANGDIVPTSFGSSLPTSLDSSMIWKITGSRDAYAFSPLSNENLYLRISDDLVLTLMDDSENCNWLYTASNTTSTGSFSTTASSAANTSPLYIFKVSMNDALDKVSDIDTKLVGKTQVKSSLSVLDSTNYVITATYNGRVYALSMRDMKNLQTLDITDTFNDAKNEGKSIHLFAPSVWNQIGTDYNLMFDSLGFSGEGFHLLSGSTGNLNNGSPTVVEVAADKVDNVEVLPDDFVAEPYEWRLTTYGDNDYILGYYSSGEDKSNYIYFDTESKTFKVSEDADDAKATGSKVEIYQLGNTKTGVIFQTFAIALKEDRVTVASYPLNEAEAADIKQYTGTGISQDSTIDNLVVGEYMIIANVGKSYYAVTFDSDGSIQMVDVSLLFSGNFIKDSAGNYCISINQDYLWKQTAEDYTLSNGVVSGIHLQNFTTSSNLTFNGSDSLSYDGKQLYVTVNDVNTYLNFSESTGFTTSENESNISIKLYAIGTGSISTGGEEMQYSYYSYAINTNMIDFSLFDFSKVQISELTRYANEEDGKLTTSQGWKLTGTTYLSEVNTSVFFADGTPYSSDLETFADSFVPVSYKYTTTSEESDEVIDHQIDYYAPSGMVAFVVPEASPESMAYINVIVSTEFDAETYNENQLRYLSMWKVASVDINEGTTETVYESDSELNNYAYTLQQKFYKPDGAIPLPNHYGEDNNPASYVKVTEKDQGSDIYYLSSDELGYDHLIAHTFSVSEPGIYYIGSTYGSVAFCYMSIDNMVAPEDGEDNSEVVAENFTIDFVWGTPASSGTYGDDSSLGTVCYVGKRTANDESQTWVHSNIYPKFINGTAGLYDEGEDGKSPKPEGYNPTDSLQMTVQRTYYDQDETGENPFYVSKVTVAAITTTAIDNSGTGVMYSNMNNATKRTKRKVDFSVTLSDASNNPTN